MRRLIKSQGGGREMMLITLIAALFISGVSFSYKHFSRNEHKSKLKEIETSLADIRSSMDLASMKQHNIQKVKKIIDQFNKAMVEDEKQKIGNEIHDMSLKYTNLNVDLICATITHESALTWDPQVVSPVGALGLMQIMPETGQKLAQQEGVTWTTPEKILLNPIFNIRLGCRYLSELIQLYEVDGGLAAYNGGGRRAKLWLNKRTHKTDLSLLREETQVYVPSILKLYAEYQIQTGIL